TADAATTAAQGASGAHAVDAALTAGRKTASQHYRAITAADETGGAATGTATDSDSDSDTTSDGTTSGTTSGTDSTGTTSGTDSTGGTGTSDDSGAGTSGTGTSGTSGTSGDDEDDSDDSTSSTGSGTSSGTSSGSGSTGSGSTGKHSSSTGDTSGTRSERIERVIARGKSQLGVRYSWGGGNYDGPTIGIRDGGVADQYGDYQNVGFDCSGLMMYAFAAAGVKLDHYSGYQYTAGEQIPVAQAERGDMLFWGAGGSEHVALYLGDGKMLEAPQSGSQVRISDVRWGGIQPYAVRVID
ncbi:NlpC/P60 family protein, partial [Corynebacterium bovis]